jgi:hypothetical protein
MRAGRADNYPDLGMFDGGRDQGSGIRDQGCLRLQAEALDGTDP